METPWILKVDEDGTEWVRATQVNSIEILSIEFHDLLTVEFRAPGRWVVRWGQDIYSEQGGFKREPSQKTDEFRNETEYPLARALELALEQRADIRRTYGTQFRDTTHCRAMTQAEFETYLNPEPE